ncbi:hypothetical protein ACFQMJ_35190 [Cohnella cellulosilytica]|uniref:Uncharacterized protein n=1 Tax=Cohnella cellulosilytica TaxID=986710 RepID=A0ABW2FKX3_9BACL
MSGGTASGTVRIGALGGELPESGGAEFARKGGKLTVRTVVNYDKVLIG